MPDMQTVASVPNGSGFWGSLVGVLIGAMFSFLIAVFIENLRMPRLRFITLDPIDRNNTGPAKVARFLVVGLKNDPLPWVCRWMLRSPALHCHGYIRFYHTDGQPVFSKAMPLRWSYSPQPLPMKILFEDKTGIIVDPLRFDLRQNMDIYPGETADLDIAGRFDQEEDSYGWTTESFFKNWRHPSWQLRPGCYVVRVTVISSAQKCEGFFRLVSDVPMDSFRIIDCLPGDREKVLVVER